MGGVLSEFYAVTRKYYIILFDNASDMATVLCYVVLCYAILRGVQCCTVVDILLVHVRMIL